MAQLVNVLGYDGNPFDQRSCIVVPRFIKTLVRLAIQAGAYVAGGVTLDFTNGGGTPTLPSTFPAAAVGVAAGPSSGIVKANGPAGSVSANGGGYVLIPGTLPTNWKLKIFATAGTEYAAGAFGADALTDVLTAEMDWPR